MRYIIAMYYTSVTSIHTTLSYELVLLLLVCVSVVLIISPEIFIACVAIITIQMVPLIATNASIDHISFITCLITPTSTILIISPMITFITTILIVSLLVISVSTILTTSLTISITTILTSS